MKNGAEKFWAVVMYGGPGSNSAVEKVEYNPNYLGSLFNSGRVIGAD
jgi:hypothetical protein